MTELTGNWVTGKFLRLGDVWVHVDTITAIEVEFERNAGAQSLYGVKVRSTALGAARFYRHNCAGKEAAEVVAEELAAVVAVAANGRSTS